MSKIATFATGLALALLVSESHAASADLTRDTAPDAVSRAILAQHVRLDEGALTPQDRPAAIHRNYPMVIEQNFARMDGTHSAAWVDQLSDAELQAIAQLYANANADSHHTGSLLLVAANRMDGTHLARLSKFFGYAPVYNAILSAAPTKAQSFAQHTPVAFAAPVAGGLAPMMLAQPEAGFSAAPNAFDAEGGTPAMQASFTPNAGMTLQEIFTGFRGMQIGGMSTVAAFYETHVYAGVKLGIAWGTNWGFGTALASLAQTYLPTWYSGTFVVKVGTPVTWLQNAITTMANLSPTNYLSELGIYERNEAPNLIPTTIEIPISETGGDDYVAGAWESVAGTNAGCPNSAFPVGSSPNQINPTCPPM